MSQTNTSVVPFQSKWHTSSALKHSRLNNKSNNSQLETPVPWLMADSKLWTFAVLRWAELRSQAQVVLKHAAEVASNGAQLAVWLEEDREFQVIDFRQKTKKPSTGSFIVHLLAHWSHSLRCVNICWCFCLQDWPEAIAWFFGIAFFFVFLFLFRHPFRGRTQQTNLFL